MSCCSTFRSRGSKLAAMTVIFAGAGLLGLNFLPNPATSQTIAPLPASLPETDAMRAADSLSSAFRAVIKACQPAVVAIRTETDRDADTTARNGIPDDFLDQLPPQLRRQFGMPFGGQPFGGQQGTQPNVPLRGVGSGFVVGSDGVVLTNNHVIEGADRIYVTLDDGRELEATRWEADVASDVAVVFVETDKPLPFVRLADSDTVELGDWVLAFGNPFDIGTTTTQGIISAKQRRTGLNIRENYLQTDAAINPGNSGGPLINLRGEVIGVNTAISSRSGGYDGVGFAIPSNMVRWAADQLIEKGKVERSYLGVALMDPNRELRKELDLGPREGVVVTDVRPNTPAGKAGLKKNDVILSLNGNPISGGSELAGMVERLAPGQAYEMQVKRDGTIQAVNVTLEAMPDKYFEMASRPQSTQRPEAQLGLGVGELSPVIAEQLGIEATEGIVVTDVEPNGPSADAGLQVGDVIVRVGKQDVKTVDEFRSQAAGLISEGSVLMTVNRDGRDKMVIVKVAE